MCDLSFFCHCLLYEACTMATGEFPVSRLFSQIVSAATDSSMERVEGFRLGATSRRALEKSVLARRGICPPGVPDVGKPDRNAVAQRLGEGMAPQMGIGKARGILDRLATTGMYAGAGFMPAWKAGPADLRKPIPQFLRELEKITFRADEAVLEIVVPLD